MGNGIGLLNGRTVRANPPLAPVAEGAAAGGVGVDAPPDFSRGLANLNGFTGLLLSEAGDGVDFKLFPKLWHNIMYGRLGILI